MCRFQLVTGRTWRGSAFGGVKGRTELPGLVEGMSLLLVFALPIGSLALQTTSPASSRLTNT